ncbi:MAG: DUF262 domain-containing protein [Anaerolineales bacterium]
MKADPARIYELFQIPRRYVVPLFQRPYVWTLDRQWKPLWGDISAKADEYLSWDDRESSEPAKHFLGAIVLNPLPISGFQVPARLIIDGQQRLTTLQIILIALRDYAVKVKHSDLSRDLTKHILNDCRMENGFEKYKVWPTNADQKLFVDIFDSGSVDELENRYPEVRLPRRWYPEPRPSLVAAYLFFYRSIETYVNAGADTQAAEDDQRKQIFRRLDAIDRTFSNYLEIVTIDLDEHDNPQVIFETLNFRGEPLSPSDLIRNFVFLEATNQRKPVEDLYQKYWYDFDKRDEKGNPSFWKQDEKTGRFFRLRMDLYIFQYLTLKTGREVTMGRLYQEFIDWWRNTERDIECELKDLKAYSQTFLSLYHPDINTRIGIFARRLRMMEVGTIYPLLLYLFQTRKADIPPEDLDGIVVDLESFLVRRMICGLPTKNYNNLFLSWLASLKEIPIIDRQTVRNLLLQSDAETSRWPDDKKLEERWFTRDVYHGLGPRAKIVLEAIDLQLTTSKQEQVHLTGTLTLEHLMPQSWQEADYPLPLLPNDAARTTLMERRSMLLHTFGNLTLLTQALNSAISNGAFDAKLKEIRRHSLLRLNTECFKPFSDGHWTEDDIHARGDVLLVVAKQIWSYP